MSLNSYELVNENSNQPKLEFIIYLFRVYKLVQRVWEIESDIIFDCQVNFSIFDGISNLEQIQTNGKLIAQFSLLEKYSSCKDPILELAINYFQISDEEINFLKIKIYLIIGISYLEHCLIKSNSNLDFREALKIYSFIVVHAQKLSKEEYLPFQQTFRSIFVAILDIHDGELSALGKDGLSLNYFVHGICLDDIDLSRRRIDGLHCQDISLNYANLSDTILQNLKIHCSQEQQTTYTNLSNSKISSSGFNISFSSLNLTQAELKYCSMGYTQMTSTIAINSIFKMSSLQGTDLSNSCFGKSRLINTNLQESNLTSVDLSGADWSGVILNNANLKNVNLSGTNLSGANLQGADLTGSIIDQHTVLTKAIYSPQTILPQGFPTETMYYFAPGSNLQGIIIRNETIISDTEKTIEALVGIPLQVFLENLDISNANMLESIIENVTMTNCNFSGVDFGHASISRSCFNRSNFSGANLANTNLIDAVFNDCNFTNTNFIGAKLTPNYTFSYEINDELFGFLDYILEYLSSKGNFLTFNHFPFLKDIFENINKTQPAELKNLVDKYIASLTGQKKFQFLRVLNLLGIKELLPDHGFKRVEKLLAENEQLPEAIRINLGGIEGIQTLAFKHLQSISKEIINILLNPQELEVQLLDPNSNLLTLVPELLSLALTKEKIRLFEDSLKYRDPKNLYQLVYTPGPYQHNGHKYKLLLEHTLRVIQSIQNTDVYQNSADDNTRVILTLASLFHDLGKPTRLEEGHSDIDQDHGDKSLDIAYQILDRLGFDYNYKKEVIFLIKNKERLAKITETRPFTLPDEDMINALAIEIGSSKNWEMVLALGKWDSYRVFDDMTYWNNYKKNRGLLEEKLLPKIKYYENLNYPVINNSRLFSNSKFQSYTWFENEDKRNHHIEVSTIQPDPNLFLYLHYTDYLDKDMGLDFNRPGFEKDFLMSATYSQIYGQPRIYKLNNSALIVNGTSTISGFLNLSSGDNLSTSNLVSNNTKLENTAIQKFNLIQSYLYDNIIVNSREIIHFFREGSASDKIPNSSNFFKIIEDIEDIDFILNYYQRFNCFPFTPKDKKQIDEMTEAQKVEYEKSLQLFNKFSTIAPTIIQKLSELMAKLHASDIVNFKNSNDYLRPIQTKVFNSTNHNEFKMYFNQIEGVFIHLQKGYNMDNLSKDFRLQLRFAEKHNLPVLVYFY